MSKTAFLGPLGTFTHQAAVQLSSDTDDLVPLADIDAVYDAVERREVDSAVVPLENSVEGYVVPSLDRLLYGSVVGFARLELPIEFSALAKVGSTPPYRVAVSHPHALAQCKTFIAGQKLVTKASASTAAACADLQSDAIALAPDICRKVYGLEVVARNVQDQSGALTSFLKIRRRDAMSEGEQNSSGTPTTMFSITPRVTGPGVLARITNSLSSSGVNIQSLITRPVKSVPSAYTFILTVTGAPSTGALREVIPHLLAAGDILKVLAIYWWRSRDPSEVAVDGSKILAGAPPESCVDADNKAAISRALLTPWDAITLTRDSA